MNRRSVLALLAAAAVLSGCGGSARGDGQGRSVEPPPDPCMSFRPVIERVEIGLGDVYVKKPDSVPAVTAALKELQTATVGSAVVSPALIKDFVIKATRYAAALKADPAKGYSGTVGLQYRSAAGKLGAACQPTVTIPGA